MITIDDIIGISGTKREVLVGKVLLIASALLSIASGFTTFFGLSEYFPFIISLFVTIGIQSLLFATSWRIGSDYKVGQFSTYTILIFFITLSSSVFFSYSSILNKIYNKENRQKDEIIYSQKESIKIVSDLKSEILNSFSLDSLNKVVSNEILDWHNTSSIEINNKIVDLNKKVEKYKRRKENLSNTIKQQSNILRYSNDSLTRARYYANIRNRNYIDNKYLSSNSIEFSQANRINNQIKNDINLLIQNKDSLTLNRLKEIVRLKTSLNSVLSIDSIPNISENTFENIYKFERANKFINLCNSYNPLDINNIDSLRNGIINISNKLDFIDSKKSNRILTKAFDFGKESGKNVHYFTVSTTQLKRGNSLAKGALLIAVILDLLVFFCGILGAQPSSLLLLSNSKQLKNIAEIGLLNSLGLDLNSDLPENIPLRTKRMIDILNNSIPDLEYAEKGTPSYIPFNKVQEIGLSSELGVLLSTGLAIQYDDNDNIYLRTRLLLWFTYEINKQLKNKENG